MRGRKSDELAQLDRGLRQAEEGPDYIPPEVAGHLADKTVEELDALFIEGCNLTSLIMAQKGWILMAIKKQVGQGNFKKHLLEINVQYTYANHCMHVARAVARHPDLTKIGNTNTLRKVAYLPESTQAVIEVELKQITEIHESDGRSRKTTKTWHDLRPWVLAQIGADIKSKDKPPRPKRTDELAPEETLDQKALVTLFTKALLALGDLAVHVEGLTLGDEDYDWIYARKLVDKLGASFDRTVAALNPIEQVERRGEIIA